jgi:charged multivesicular body protein 7
MVETLDSYLSSLPEGSNKNRLAYLYSDFTRGDNTAGARANVEWWKATLSHILARGLQAGGSGGEGESVIHITDKLVLHADQALLERLRREGVGRPMAIGYVLVSPHPFPIIQLQVRGLNQYRRIYIYGKC